MKEREIVYKGPGILSMLLVAFIVLKLTGQIAWSWWWVLAPLWGPAALILGVFMMLGFVALVAGAVEALRK